MRWYVQDYSRKRDEELVLLAQRGDALASEELLNRYKHVVRALARKYFFLGEVDDLVQEGMIGLYKAIGDYDAASGKSFKNFAYLCVTRKIVDALRAAQRHKTEDALTDPDAFGGGDTPEDSLLQGESRTEFQMKLSKALSDFEFRVITMYLEGMSYLEICEATGKDLKSVDNALARSKRKLQKAFSH